MEMIEHPAIARMKATGFDRDEGPAILCPICSVETDTFYVDLEGEVVGCPECITAKNPYECKGY